MEPLDAPTGFCIAAAAMQLKIKNPPPNASMKMRFYVRYAPKPSNPTVAYLLLLMTAIWHIRRPLSKAVPNATLPQQISRPPKHSPIALISTPKLLGAVLVPDGTFDPLRLALSFAASAKSLGAKFMLYTDVTDLLIDQTNVIGIKAVNR